MAPLRTLPARKRRLQEYLALFCFLLALVSWLPSPAEAQTGLESGAEKEESEPTSAIDPDLASPRDTLTTFIKGIEAAQGADEEQQWERVYKTLEIPKSAGDSRREAALRLKQVLNRLGKLDPEKIAPNAEGTAEERLEIFELFPDNPYPDAKRQFDKRLLRPGAEPPEKLILARDPQLGWRFNAESIEAINPLFSWLEEQGMISREVEAEVPLADVIRKRVPEWMKRGFFLGMEVWQWIFLSLILLISVALYWACTVLFSAVINFGWRRFRAHPTEEDRRRVARPLALIVGALIFIFLLKLTGIIGTPLAVFLLAGRLVLVAGATWTAWSLTNFLSNLWSRHAEGTETTFDDMLVPLVSKTLKLIIIIWAIIYIADAIDILNFVTPLLAGFGLAGLAVSFAAQDLIRNLFGGITIFLDRPYQVGERIIIDGADGVVEEIGFRSTKLRTADGHLVSVPNGAVTSHSVENVGRRPSIRRDFKIGITYDTSPDLVRKATETVRAVLDEPDIAEKLNPKIGGNEFPPRVFFEEFGDSALIIRVIYWYSESGYWDYMEHANRINLRLLEEFEKIGVEFAFPTQTLYLYQEKE